MDDGRRRGWEAVLSEETTSYIRRSVKRTPPRADRIQGNARAESTSALIYRALRQDIITLTVAPGTPILERSIAEHYGVSRTPAREAVRQLADEGLIDVFPQSGTFVARIPLGELEEAIVIRNALEETSARLAAERATPAAIARIERAMAAIAVSAASEDREAFHADDELFHAEICGASGYPGIWRVTQQVKVQLDRYRRLTLPEEGRLARVVREHQEVLDAIKAGDGRAAASAMNRHLTKLIADLSTVAERYPDHFKPAAASSPLRLAGPADPQSSSASGA